MAALKVSEVAQRLNLSRSAVYKLAKEGKLPLVKTYCSAVRIDGDRLMGKESVTQKRVSRSLKNEKNETLEPYHHKGDRTWLD